MKLAALFGLFAFLPLAALAEPAPHEREIQRALIQLDERSAAFARGTPPAPLDPLAGRPLAADPVIARELRPYERMRAAEEREANVLRLPPPVARADEKPLPLPGGPRAGVDPVAAPRLAN